jgi:hypothetical protein
MPSASANAPFQLALRSPIAETNTQAKVAGASPPYFPNTMNKNGPAMMQSQPRQSGFAGSTLSPSSAPPAREVPAMVIPISTRMTPSATGKNPGPIWRMVPIL